jgi:hypothetical protein
VYSVLRTPVRCISVIRREYSSTIILTVN